MSQPRPNTALQEFFQWESQSWVEIVADLNTDEKTRFIPLDQLKSYFSAEDGETLRKILSEVFQTSFPPIDPETILREHIAIFCILLHMGQGQYIEEFVRYEELSDRRLPFDLNRSPAEFPLIHDDPRLFNHFCEQQWAYCVPIFDGNMIHKIFGIERRLPITKKEICMEGSTDLAIELYGSYNKLIPAAQKSLTSPQSNSVVLQRYPRPGGDKLYNERVNGFRSVKNTDSIRRFYGSYIQGGYFNIMLEYASGGTLEEYLKRETPPSRGPDIVRLWEGLFQLLRGLKTIHAVREGHHDISLQSILVFGDMRDPGSDYKFKFSTFGKSALLDPFLEANARQIASIAPTYEAPESYMPYSNHESRNSSKLTWAADIWSVGCIYSEVAMWIADGYNGLLDYRRHRLSETKRISFKGGDCFHDGERTLQAVLDAHMDIEGRLRRSDYITKDVLDTMVDEMMWEEDRPSANALVRKADMVLSRARQRLAANSTDEFSRSGSNASRPIPPARLQPPTQPLPPIPRSHSSSALASVEERPLANVETWRSQITTSLPLSHQISNRSTVDSTMLPMSRLRRGPSVQNSDNGSAASWQQGDNNSLASPLTPLTSPHMSYNEDLHGQIPNERRSRTLVNQRSFESRSSPPETGSPYQAAANPIALYSDQESKILPMCPPPPPRDERRSYIQPEITQKDRNSLNTLPSQIQRAWNEDSVAPLALPTTPKKEASRQSRQQHTEQGPPTPPPATQWQIQQSLPPVPVQTWQPQQSPPPPPPVQQYQTQQEPLPTPLQQWQTQKTPPNVPAQQWQPQQTRPSVPVQQWQPQHAAPLLHQYQSQPPVAPPQSFYQQSVNTEPSRGGSRQSSIHTLPSPQTRASEIVSIESSAQARPKSQKKIGGFSLFPRKLSSKVSQPPPPPAPQQLQKTFSNDSETLPQISVSSRPPTSLSSRPSTLGPSPSIYSNRESITYISPAECLTHRNVSQKVKKSRQSPLLPKTASTWLAERDHCFIVDDSSSMKSIWPSVKETFSALSYAVKGFGTLGTELFFTISYDTWQRKDPADLERFLNLRAVQGDTDIAYRLNLQLQTFTHRWNTYKKAAEKERIKKKLQPVRPISFYIFTNGEWQKGDKLKPIIHDLVTFLKTEELEARNMITIQFVSFAVSPSAVDKLNDLVATDFGANMVDVTSSTGNVLKMLRGCVDKSLAETEDGGMVAGTSLFGEESRGLADKLHAFPTSIRPFSVNELE